MEQKGSKILTTERLVLRPFRVSDAEAMFYGWANDPEVTKFLTWTPHASIDVTRRLLALREEESKLPDVYHWAITLNGEPIGDIEIGKVDRLETGNAGYCLAKKFWGKGIMTEAFREVIRFAFAEVGLHRIEGMHAKHNIGSSRVMEKCGLKYEGTRRDGYRLLSTNEWEDIVVRGILSKDYFAAKS